MVDEAETVRRPTLVTSDGQVDGTLVTEVLIVEFGGNAIVRGTACGSIRNRGGHVHLLGVAGEVVDAAPGTVQSRVPYASTNEDTPEPTKAGVSDAAPA